MGEKYLQVIYLIRVNIQNIKAITQLNNKNTHMQSDFKMGKNPNRHFSKEDIQTNRYIKRCSILVKCKSVPHVSNQMQIILTPVRMASIKKTRDM